MTAKHLKWPFLGLLVGFLVAANLAPSGTFGVSSEWSSSNGYHFSGGTQPWALAFALGIISLYLLLRYTEPATLGPPLPGVFRRFIAFWLDFILAMVAVAPVFGIVPMLAEWKRTGVFEWSFERTTHAPGDGLLIAAGMVLTIGALVFYYALPLLWGRPTPGTCIAGYQIVPDDGVTLTLRTALLRTLLGFIAACGAYIAPFIARDRKRGKFWLDNVFHTRAVTLA